MAEKKDKRPDFVGNSGEYRVELRRRRNCVDADVYRDKDLVEELEYPRLAAYDVAGLSAFAEEAVKIARYRAKEAEPEEAKK